MIIQLLGANGSGKSTIVKSIIAGAKESNPLFFLGRQRPDAMELDDAFVAGHYIGSACGGADTLPVREVQYIIYKLLRDHRPVLVEGPTGREPQLGGDIRAVHLRRDHEQNLEDWVARNLEKGLKVNRMVMLRRIIQATKRCDNIVKEYVSRGLTVTTTSSREAAGATIRKLIRR